MNAKFLTLTFLCLTFLGELYGHPPTIYPTKSALIFNPYSRLGNRFNAYKSHLTPLNKYRLLQRYKNYLQGNKANKDGPIFLFSFLGPTGRRIESGQPQDYYEIVSQNVRSTQLPYNPVTDVNKENTNEDAPLTFPSDEEKYMRDYNGIDVRSN